MNPSWQKVRLGDIIDLIGGGTPKTTIKEYWDGEIPWLSVVDFNTELKHVNSTEKLITKKGFEQSSTKILNKGDIIISAHGTVGVIAVLERPMAFNQSCYGICGKNNIIENDFLYYILKSSIENLRQISHGSVFSTITRETFDNVDIVLPPLPTQRAIAATLSCLDDKIELNSRINANLEAQAQAIFKSWFVDFEPFQGEKFVDSELGKIPNGWRMGRLGEIADITMGQSPDGSSYNETGNGTVFYQGRAEFGWRYPMNRLYTTEPKRMAKKSDILMSVRAPVGDINIADEDCCIGRGLAAINCKYTSLIFYTMKSLKTRLDMFNGEGTVFGSINKDSLNDMKIIIPTDKPIQDFEVVCTTMDKQIFNNEIQSRALAAIRDALLPKLMSGEIRVGDEK
jgi:type I restriction enzyme S subunit